VADVKWIKIVVDIFDDEKIRFIETLPNGDGIIVIWFKLVCLAGKSNCSGFLMMTDKIAYTDEILCSIFNRDIKLIKLALQTFERLDMIEITDNKIYLPNWEKHQSAEKLQKIKDDGRKRVEKHRLNAKCNEKSVTKTLQPCYSNAIEVEIELELEKDFKNTMGKKTLKFIIPTIDEIKDYCQERNNNVDAEMFFNFYESKGWLVGKAKMKDWKACVHTWERKYKSQSGQAKSFMDIEV
jgi:predicted phage replisome organizer